MTAALFKHTSSTALRAALIVAIGDEQTAPQAPEPDARDVENMALRKEIELLGRRISALQADWRAKLDEAQADAKREAALEHVRDDERAAEAIEGAFRGAAQQFEHALSDQVEPLAVHIAARTIERLIALSEDETEWLGRVISRRLEEIAAAKVNAVLVAPGLGGDALERVLAAALAKGIALKSDPALSPGTAKIVLTLGEIEILPRQGARALIEVLDQIGSGHG